MTEEELKELYESNNLYLASAVENQLGDFRTHPHSEVSKSMTSGFTKADTNKNQLSLIDPLFITELGEVLSFGSRKYSPNNWKLCSDPTRYKDALLRHLYAYLSGELTDPESGLPHTSAIAFNTMALRWFDRQLTQKDQQ